MNLICVWNQFSFKMSLLPKTTEAIYFKDYEQTQTLFTLFTVCLSESQTPFINFVQAPSDHLGTSPKAIALGAPHTL